MREPALSLDDIAARCMLMNGKFMPGSTPHVVGRGAWGVVCGQRVCGQRVSVVLLRVSQL